MAEYIEREAVLEILSGRNAPWDGYQKVADLRIADVVSKAAYDQVAWERNLAEEQLKSIGKSLGEKMDDIQPVKQGNDPAGAEEELENEMSKKIVRCKDCIYWKDKHVRLPDGRERQYLPEDYENIDGNKLLIPSVTADVGINVGSQCLYESNRGWACDKTVFRNADDYCSRAEKRTTSYESCWNICDGWYALESSS